MPFSDLPICYFDSGLMVPGKHPLTMRLTDAIMDCTTLSITLKVFHACNQ